MTEDLALLTNLLSPTSHPPHSTPSYIGKARSKALGTCEDTLKMIKRDVWCVERLLAWLVPFLLRIVERKQTHATCTAAAPPALNLVRALLALTLWLPYLVLMPMCTSVPALIVVGRVYPCAFACASSPSDAHLSLCPSWTHLVPLSLIAPILSRLYPYHILSTL
ncbi:hypothetical protein B0H17DRAFT_1221976 [Mycena rosella]|uniref:Uncharacterized protein n=1 Tax=Mycena rosella TaxID=1033263 RepID=A0AAD7AZJ0_MYCRO|nr:hypothetical protein B0H17DRAFT_1221976 [Mycena rosella]